MATGTQAAQLFLSKVGEPTGIDTCVKSMVSEVFKPLGVPVPSIVWVHEIMQPPFTKIDTPGVGDVAIFPGQGHACMITGVSGNTLQETSFGTSSGFVRSASYDVGFYDSFFRPPYDGQLSTGVETAGDITTTASGSGSNMLGIPNSLFTPQWWARFGVGALGAGVLAVAVVALLANTGAGQTVIRTVKSAGKTAAEAAVIA